MHVSGIQENLPVNKNIKYYIVIPRMTRSGKIFDIRRYSTVNHLANLAIKEEDEEDESRSITSQSEEAMESGENGTSSAEFRPDISIEECSCSENFRKDQVVEKGEEYPYLLFII